MSPADAEPPSDDGRPWLPIALLAVLYVASLALYILLGRGLELPQVTPDEFTYSTLARSVADGQGLTIRGDSIGLRSALYIYAIAPAWLATDVIADSFAIAKAIGAASCCLVAIPTWVLARRYMPPMVALIPAALTVAGSWMLSAGQIVTENLALPLAAGALAALVVALSSPGSRAGWVAVALALLATWSRAQLAILIPIAFIVLLLDVALQGADRRSRLRAHRWLLVVTGAGSLVGGVAVLAEPSLLGSYAGLAAQADLGRGLELVGLQALAFIAMSAMLPFVLALAISLRRRAWVDPELRPLLIVFWCATALFVVQSGIVATAFDGVDWSIQRYVEYSLPLVFVLAVASIWRGLLEPWRVVGATVVTASLLLLTPDVLNPQEQGAILGIAAAGDTLLGAGAGVSLALAILATGLVTAALLAAGDARSRLGPLIAVFLVGTGAILVVQDAKSWGWLHDRTATLRSPGFPPDLQWIDHAAEGPVARLVGNSTSFQAEVTHFFNRDVDRIYTPEAGVGGVQIVGPTCAWAVSPEGVPEFSPKCGAVPTRFLLSDEFAKYTFHGQRVLGSHAVGRVVELPATTPGRPRLKAWITPACSGLLSTLDTRTAKSRPPRTRCFTQSTGQLWLDSPGRVVMRLRGGSQDLTVQAASSLSPDPRTLELPAGATRRLTFDAPTGASEFVVDFGLDQPMTEKAPLQTSIQLVQDGKGEELLY